MSTPPEGRAYFNIRRRLAAVWPEHIVPVPGADLLRQIYVGVLEAPDANPPLFRVETLLRQSIPVPLPGVEGVELLIGGQESTVFWLEVEAGSPAEVRLEGVPMSLRVAEGLLRPAKRITSPEGVAEIVPIPDAGPLSIDLGEMTAEVDFDGNFGLGAATAFDLPLSLLGDTGLALELEGVAVHGGGGPPPVGRSPGWRGLAIDRATTVLPGDLGRMAGSLQVSDAVIDAGGFSGRISSDWTGQPAAQRPGGDLAGLDLRLDRVEIEVVQNSFAESLIIGELTLPFFDKPIAVRIGLGLDGGFSLEVAGAVDSSDQVNDEGLLILEKPGVCTIEVESLGFDLEGSTGSVVLTGIITPQVAGVELPGFRVDELQIDSDGHVHLEGGWLDLPDQYSIDFHGFQFEVTRLGLGQTDDGERWIGLNGGLQLVEALPVGASVEGMRIGWMPGGGSPSLSFGGIGVDLEVPKTFRFRGEVAYSEEAPGEHRFAGAVELELIPLSTTLDAQVVFGTRPGYSYFAIYLGAELPAGIPLFATGLSLYGLAGLVANNMEPDKQPDEPWYGVGPGEGWYKRPQVGVTDLAGKWVDRAGSFALGAGVTLGTAPDNGYAFAGKFLLAVVLPGPIVMLEGKANIMKERASLGSGEPNFRALVVLDNRAGTLQAGLDASYRFGEKGSLVDIRGSVDAFFSYSDPTAWHLYLGQKEPREKRIAAEVFSLWEATAYYMVDARSLAFGASVGIDQRYRLGPLSVALTAQIEGGARLNWMPPHLHGEVGLYGSVSLRVFGFGFGLSASAEISADVFDPFLLRGDFRVSVSLPWPLDDVGGTVTLQWGPKPKVPPIPLPTHEIGFEHLKVSTTWPLPRGSLILPDYRRDRVYLDRSVDPGAQRVAPPPADLPVVPTDGRPTLTFRRPVNDAALVGVTAAGAEVWERVGDPARGEGPVRLRYRLTHIALEAWRAGIGDWETLAEKGDGSDSGNLYGAWASVPPMDEGQSGSANTKLTLWSKNPFHMARFSGRGWEEGYTGGEDSYPCVVDRFCYDFGHFPWGFRFPGRLIGLDFRGWDVADEPVDVFWSTARDGPLISRDEGTHTLRFGSPPPGTGPRERQVTVRLPRRFSSIQIEIVAKRAGEVLVPTSAGTRIRRTWPADAGRVTLVCNGGPGERLGPFVEIVPDDSFALVAICGAEEDLETMDETLERAASHMVREARRWSFPDPTIAPFTTYRLAVTTQVTAEGAGALAGKVDFDHRVTEFAYFRTEGPPGLADHSAPVGHPTPRRFGSGLEDLTAYVSETLPRTGVGGGRGLLPRPVYAAYDVGLTFNENYVDRLYGAAGRDLALRFFDSNGEPVRDHGGNLLQSRRRWGNAEVLLLDRSDRSWLSLVRRQNCLPVESAEIRRNRTLSLSSGTLPPDRLIEARLTPAKWAESFHPRPIGPAATDPGTTGFEEWDDFALSGQPVWEIRSHEAYAGRTVFQDGNRYRLGGLAPEELARLSGGSDTLLIPEAPGGSASFRITGVDPALGELELLGQPDLSALPAGARWVIPALGELTQSALVGPNPVNPFGGRFPGAMLTLGRVRGGGPDPADWQDYAFSLAVEVGDAAFGGSAAVGVLFRAHTGSNARRFYLYVMSSSARKLIWVDGQRWRTLAEDEDGIETDRRYDVTVEAVGTRLRVFQDDRPVFDLDHVPADPGEQPIAAGTVGVHCSSTSGARFADLMVHDLGEAVRGVYSFDFVTSRFANFFHHLHSFRDEIWPPEAVPELPAADAGVALGPGVSSPVSEVESRVYRTLTLQLLGPVRHEHVDRVEVVRIDGTDDSVAGWLLRSPEPLEWPRISAELLTAPALPGDVVDAVPHHGLKLTDVDFGDAAAQPVTLMLDSSQSLSRVSIEWRRHRPLSLSAGDPFAPAEGFDIPLFAQNFDAVPDGGPPPGWVAVDEPPYTTRRSSWGVRNGVLRQTSNIYGFAGGRVAAPGTYLLVDEDLGGDYRVAARLRSTDNDALGLILRYQDEDNFIRFSMDRERGYRRLVKMVDGAAYTLWEDDVRYSVGRGYVVVIDCLGSDYTGWIDGEQIFSVSDESLSAGSIGLYARANRGAEFDELTVSAPYDRWVPYHTFSDEPTLARGTRVRLHSDPNTEVGDEPGLVHRFPSSGNPLPDFGGEPVHLRVLAPDGEILHSRLFRPEDDYRPLGGVRAVRSEDGTGVALLGSADPTDSLRLRLVYRRDNREVDPGSQRRTQSGSDVDEVVTLDVP